MDDHGIVFANPSLYCGWPANHGHWQWGNEFLVGFMMGNYSTKATMHNIIPPFTKLLARSRDGGQSWSLVLPAKTCGHGIDFEGVAPTVAAAFETSQNILRVCGIYDHGGENCDNQGAFYTSQDRGASWKGPFLFTGLESQFPIPGDAINTSRTCVLPMPPGQLIFLSKGLSQMWGQDETFCAYNDGIDFRFRGTVCADNARAVMPAAAQVAERIVVALRRRKSGVRGGWIDAYCSDDAGYSWKKQSWVGSAGEHNGNPPALLALSDGRLLCAFGNRDGGCIVLAVSEDRGDSWKQRVLRASESATVDIGYPRLFAREDGKAVCVYYWSSQEHPQQHIARTIFEP